MVPLPQTSRLTAEVEGLPQVGSILAAIAVHRMVERKDRGLCVGLTAFWA